ncbi:GtrA family protein, partial [Escherichia sp. TWPC-MK]
MLKLFAKYTSIGVINTLIHWVVFAICIYVFHTGQALANFAGFVVAVSFSFFANAKFTFKSSTTTMRYMLYVGFMGSLSEDHISPGLPFFNQVWNNLDRILQVDINRNNRFTGLDHA